LRCFGRRPALVSTAKDRYVAFLHDSGAVRDVATKVGVVVAAAQCGRSARGRCVDRAAAFDLREQCCRRRSGRAGCPGCAGRSGCARTTRSCLGACRVPAQPVIVLRAFLRDVKTATALVYTRDDRFRGTARCRVPHPGGSDDQRDDRHPQRRAGLESASCSCTARWLDRAAAERES
jgi:hypothetical protein